MFFQKQKKSQQKVSSLPKRPRYLYLSSQDRIFLIKRLAILLRAGVPILDALLLSGRQVKSKTAAWLLYGLSQSVAAGESLHKGMQRQQASFGHLSVSLVRVGELSGTLHENLEFLAAELKKQRELKRKIVAALTYPLFIVLATGGIVVMLTVYVFPKILPILQSFHTTLPFTTRAMIFFSNLLRFHGLALSVEILALCGLVFFLSRQEKPKKFFDRLILRLPFVGRMFASYYLANTSRTLGLMLKSDAPIVGAVRLVAETCPSSVFAAAFFDLAEHIKHGGRLSEFFFSRGRLFPESFVQMVAVGESAGRLPETLLYLSETYESEVDDLAKNLSSAIEPLLMALMGLLVGFVAISIITPIYQLTQNLNPYK